MYQLLCGDCLKEMKKIEDKKIDFIFADLPYGITKNSWDSVIPLDELWKCFYEIIKEDGVIVLTASQPFTSLLVMSNMKMFKYEIIWEKTIGSGQMNIKHRPLKVHESILVFYDKKKTYNEQKTLGDPYIIKRNLEKYGGNYNKQMNHEKKNNGFRHAKSVIKISNPRIKNGHPTQKPLELMEYIIKTFSNKGDIVLDPCMGSGSTGIAAIKNERQFIGIEQDKKYFLIAEQQLKAEEAKDVNEFFRKIEQ